MTSTCCLGCCAVGLQLDEKGLCPHCSKGPKPCDMTDALLAERGKQYGPNPFNQETIAQAWKGILEAHFQQPLPGPIPPHIVGIMMVALKLMRAATPFGFHQDNYDDMHGYVRIAEKCAKPTSPTDTPVELDTMNFTGRR